MTSRIPQENLSRIFLPDSGPERIISNQNQSDNAITDDDFFKMLMLYNRPPDCGPDTMISNQNQSENDTMDEDFLKMLMLNDGRPDCGPDTMISSQQQTENTRDEGMTEIASVSSLIPQPPQEVLPRRFMPNSGPEKRFPFYNLTLINYPKMSAIENRILTFNSWPITFIEAKDLAEAGFFYTGKEDRVQCFYCGVILCEWKNGDRVWTEHARSFPNCAYVALKKGHVFVNECLRPNTESYWKERHVYSSAILQPEVTANVLPISKKEDKVVVEPNKTTFEEDQRLCKICMDNEINIVFVPCGHIISCSHCAENLAQCAICRKIIT